MSARDMYLMQIIEKYKLTGNNLEEVYDIVCKHLQEVELTKITLEKMILKKRYDDKKEMNRIQDKLENIQDELEEFLQNLDKDGSKTEGFE